MHISEQGIELVAGTPGMIRTQALPLGTIPAKGLQKLAPHGGE